MKRVRVYQNLISDKNLRTAIEEVCKSHRWVHYPNKRNKTVVWLEDTIDERIAELRSMIENGFEPSPVIKKRRYDANAGKWRDICEPRLYPDQCIHHALIQVLQPVMMRGMDRWCCGSIKDRGAHYGIKALKKWVKGKGVKYCIELDIRHFYESLKPDEVMERMKRLLKDYKTLDLIERIIRDGIQIGAYCSQWFANTFLQPLDVLIRQAGAKRYLRYMDNFTIFVNRKKTADKIIQTVKTWLESHKLNLKDNWQKFKTVKRLPNALGYRFGRGYTLLRKGSLLRLKRNLKRFYRLRERNGFITVKFAQGLLSRLGMLRHCNSVKLYKALVKKRVQRFLKDIVREYYRKERLKCSMFTERLPVTA